MNTAHTPRPMTVSLEPQGAEQTRLHSHWLVLARFVWTTLIVLILAFFFANLPVYFAQLHTICAERGHLGQPVCHLQPSTQPLLVARVVRCRSVHRLAQVERLVGSAGITATRLRRRRTV